MTDYLAIELPEVVYLTDSQEIHYLSDIQQGPAGATGALLAVNKLSEFVTEEDKLEARTNLGITSSIDTDEKVAVVSGGTAGYIWGTDGTDGIIRMNSSMAWSKDAGNAYVTLAVGTLDCGVF